MVEHHEQVTESVLAVLADAEEPLSVGRIQRRIADDGFDVATGAIREVCRELAAEGHVEAVGDPARKYRVSE